MFRKRYAPGALLLGVVVLAAGSTRSERTFTPGWTASDWPTADGFSGSHYTPLGDITPETVEYLEVAWSYRTGDVHAHRDGMAGTAFEATPIMIDGVLYFSTPYSRAIALDAETGEELWAFDPSLDRTDESHGMVTSRGLSFWADPEGEPGEECATRIVHATFDARLFALDAKTGMPCSDFHDGDGIDLGLGIPRLVGRREHFKQTAPPAVINDVIVVGSSIFDGHFADGPGGAVRAFDVRSGELRWTWEPLIGVDGTLPSGDRISAGAANTWATITADPANDLLFVPTGSPSPDHFGGLRSGDNRYANSLVALRASTGEVVWHFQMVHHDLWDYDLPSPPALITLERDGVLIPAVVQSTKMGYLFVFHRLTGEPLFPVIERPVPATDVRGERASSTQPMPVLPPPLTPQTLDPEDAWGITPWDRAACRAKIERHRSEGVYTPPSVQGTIAYPGFIGGMEWGGVAFDPSAGVLVTNTTRLAMVATLIPREVANHTPPPEEGAKFSLTRQEHTPFSVRREPLLSPLGLPCTPPPWGMLHAVDLRSGELLWEVPLGTTSDLAMGVWAPTRWGSPNLGGPLITGGLIFIGAAMDSRLRAFDLTTGEVAWMAELPASMQSTPMSYRTSNGHRQFIVVAAGGHDGMRSALGDFVIAYSLPTNEAGESRVGNRGKRTPPFR